MAFRRVASISSLLLSWLLAGCAKESPAHEGGSSGSSGGNVSSVGTSAGLDEHGDDMGDAPFDDTGSIDEGSEGGSEDDDSGGSSDDGGSDTGEVIEPLVCTKSIGSGSGTLDVSTVMAGDVVCIAAGSYTGADLSNLSDVAFTNEDGVVVFTGLVYLSESSNLVFAGNGVPDEDYGFRFEGAGAGFNLTGHNEALTFTHFQAVDSGIFLDAGHAEMTYDGTTDSLALYQVILDRIAMDHAEELVIGNWGGVTMLQNFIVDITMSRIAVDEAQGSGQQVVHGSGIFDIDAHHWRITNSSAAEDFVGTENDRDTGVFMIAGSGRFHELRREGGWGWLVRNFAAHVGDTPAQVRIYNNIDLDTVYYGSFEVRTDDNPVGGVPYIGGLVTAVDDVVIVNNTSGNKRDRKYELDPVNEGYTTAIALIPYLRASSTAQIYNNVTFNNVEHAGATNGVLAWGVDGTLDAQQNLAFAAIDGVLDPDTLTPAAAELVDTGVAVEWLITDFYGAARDAAIDIGAVEQ
jgi:hypothetical protein